MKARRSKKAQKLLEKDESGRNLIKEIIIKNKGEKIQIEIKVDKKDIKIKQL